MADSIVVEDFLTCRNDAERGRLLDLSRRLRRVELRGSVIFMVAAVIGMPTFGPIALLPTIPGLVFFWLVQSRVDRYRRPELLLLGCVVLLQLGLAASLAIAQGPRVYLLPMMMVPVMLASVVFPVRVASLVVGISVLLMLGVAFGFDLRAVEAMPFALLYPLDVLVCGAGIAMIVAGLELSTRGAAIVDALTGLPNRLALRARVAELEHQSQLTGRPVAMIVGDPDRFKLINDTRGHAVGDSVLKELGARIRAELGPGCNGYRLGGEEFVVLIGDAEVEVAAELAERIRRSISARAIEGLGVVMSFGVAASSDEEPFEFSRIFGRADRALYEAKRAGGNRVRLWPLNGASGDAVAPLAKPAASREHQETMEALAGQFDRRDSARFPAAVGDDGAGPGGPREPLGEEDGWARWNAQEHAATGNWLVRDEVERRQLLELNRRLREKAKIAFYISFIVGGASAIQYGWQILVPTGLMAVTYVAVEHHIERFRRPEYALGLAWMGLQGSFLIAGLIANSQMIFAAPLVMILIIGSSAVFPLRGVFAGLGYTTAIMALVAIAEAPQLLSSAPGILAFDLCIVATIGMVGVSVGRSTINFRDLGVVDQLTGLFNRTALTSRVAEITNSAPATGAQVALIVADVDRFKLVNDINGHATGDAVLRELGYRIRKHLRAFESAYRIGGEEIVILLESVGRDHAENVAARLREAIAEAPLAGIQTTVSLGVAACEEQDGFDYDTLFLRADRALYEAKRAGGNCVFAAGSEGRPPVLSNGDSRLADLRPLAEPRLVAGA